MFRTVIVDDSEDVRSLWAAALEHSGRFEICGVAADGAAAVEIVRRERPDVVLLDLSMPGLHGLDTLPLLHEVSPETRVAVVSSASRREFAERATSLGACGFLEKHIPVQSLAARLLQLLSQEAVGTASTVDATTLPHPDVLLVEPDRASRELLEYLIGWLPYRVHVVVDATHGLELLRRLTPRAALIDLHRFPGDDTDAVQELCRTCAEAGIPVISLAGAEEDLVDRGLPTGAVDQLPHPITSEELGQVLRRWVDPPAGAAESGEGAETAARAALAALIHEVGPAAAGTAWTAFARATTNRCAAAEHALRDSDPGALATVAHAVRGSAAMIGLPALAAVGADLEATAGRGDLDRAAAVVVSLQVYRDAVRAVGAALVVPAPRLGGTTNQTGDDGIPTTIGAKPRRLLKWRGGR